MSDLDQLFERVTTVQLQSNAAKQRAFLRTLQQTLGPNWSLSSLTPGPSPNVYLVPQAVEAEIRRQPALAQDAAWEEQLKSWGALSVNILSKTAFQALAMRGAVVVNGRLVSPPKLSEPRTLTQLAATRGTVALPRDFAGPFDWHIDERGVNAAAAWRMFASDSRHMNALPWAGIRIAHIDTGYSEHVALGWSGGSSSTVLPSQGKDYLDGKHDLDGPRDPFQPTGNPGHGTRISAAIAGFFPSAPGGPFYGVAPGVQIIPYRVTESVIIDHVTDHVCEAIRDAIRNNCHVVNISLGALGFPFLPPRNLADALDEAYDAGLIVCCAAGQVWGEVIYPGRFNRCVTMGGVGPGFKPWAAAAKGPYVDLCGPADAIRRIQPANLPPGQAGQAIEDGTGDGTSYATAACSAAAALWLAWHGVSQLRSTYAGGLWQIPKAFKWLAMKNASPGKWPTHENGNYGAGVLNIVALLQAPLPRAGSMRPENPAFGPIDDGSL